MTRLSPPAPRRPADAIVGSDVVEILHDDAHLGSHVRRELYHRALDELGCDPADVMAVRISEGGVEVDVIDFEHPSWPLRTVRRGPAARLRRGA